MWKRTLLIDENDDDDDDDDEDVEGNSFSTRAAPSYIYPSICAKRQKDPRTGPIESGGSTVTQKVPTASKRQQKTIQRQHTAYLLNSRVYTESTFNQGHCLARRGQVASFTTRDACFKPISSLLPPSSATFNSARPPHPQSSQPRCFRYAKNMTVGSNVWSDSGTRVEAESERDAVVSGTGHSPYR
jgi:hypothetical protein